MTLVIYSPGRAQQLRYLLWTGFILAAAFVGLATFILVAGGSARFAAFVAVPAVVLLPSAMISLRALEERGRAARLGCVVTGVLLIAVGLFLTALVVGILPSIVGVLLLLLALLPDVGDQGSSHESPRQ